MKKDIGMTHAELMAEHMSDIVAELEDLELMDRMQSFDLIASDDIDDFDQRCESMLSRPKRSMSMAIQCPD